MVRVRVALVRAPVLSPVATVSELSTSPWFSVSGLHLVAEKVGEAAGCSLFHPFLDTPPPLTHPPPSCRRIRRVARPPHARARLLVSAQGAGGGRPKPPSTAEPAARPRAVRCRVPVRAPSSGRRSGPSTVRSFAPYLMDMCHIKYSRSGTHAEPSAARSPAMR